MNYRSGVGGLNLVSLAHCCEKRQHVFMEGSLSKERAESLAATVEVGNWGAHFTPTTLARRLVPVLGKAMAVPCTSKAVACEPCPCRDKRVIRRRAVDHLQ